MSTASPPSCHRRTAVARIFLVIQVLAVAALLFWTGKLQRVYVNDSPGYVDYPWDSLQLMFASIRTPGFPAFLKLADLFSAEQRAVPLLVFILFAAAALAFFEAVRISTGHVATATWAASSLLYANILHGYVNTIATDTLAAATGVFTCAALLLWLKRPRAWTLFAVAAFSALGWLVRPANIFLCAFAPAAAWVLWAWVPPERNRGRSAAILGLSLAVCLPPATYATLRWSVIGNWGIVSFGGYNAIGIAGQLITSDLIDRIPETSRSIASGGLSRRNQLPKSAAGSESESRLDYMRMERQYDQTIWHEFTPAALEAVGDHPARINQALGRLAAETVQLRPFEYAIWLAKATRQAVKKLFLDIADNPMDLGVLLIIAVAFVIRVMLATKNETMLDGHADSSRSAVLTVAAIAILYAGFSLAVVIPVCPPLGRMTDAAGVLLPTALFGLLGAVASNSIRSSNEGPTH